MATAVVSNHFKYQKDMGLVNMDTDSFKLILLDDSFTFNKDTHATLADVTADQLATDNGYTQDSITLANSTVTEDDSLDAGKTVFDDVTITASSGDIGPFQAVLIYNDTTGDDTVFCCVMLAAPYTILDGTSYLIQNITALTT